MRNKLIQLTIVCFFIAFITNIYEYAEAQQQPPQSQNVEYNLKINAQELDLIGKSLGLMPFNDVAGLIQKLRSQVIEQQPKETEKK